MRRSRRRAAQAAQCSLLHANLVRFGPAYGGGGARPNADFDDLEFAEPATDFATFAEEVRLARAVTVGRSLDDTFVHPQRDMAINLRWVYVHMIEEYARHNGHADLLRERIDGLTRAHWAGG